MSIRVCSMPGCQTTAGCKCQSSWWPIGTRQVPTVTTDGTMPLKTCHAHPKIAKPVGAVFGIPVFEDPTLAEGTVEFRDGRGNLIARFLNVAPQTPH